MGRRHASPYMKASLSPWMLGAALVFTLGGCTVEEDPETTFPEYRGATSKKKNCTYTQGYWKNHLQAWPGTTATAVGCGQTWPENLETPVGRVIRLNNPVALRSHARASQPFVGKIFFEKCGLLTTIINI